MSKKPQKVINNLVAKHMHKFNKPAVHANKKKDYKRSPKHKPRFGDCSFGARETHYSRRLIALAA